VGAAVSHALVIKTADNPLARQRLSVGALRRTGFLKIAEMDLRSAAASWSGAMAPTPVRLPDLALARPSAMTGEVSHSALAARQVQGDPGGRTLELSVHPASASLGANSARPTPPA